MTDDVVIAEVLNAYFGSMFLVDDGRTLEFNKFDNLEPIENVCTSEEGILTLLLKLDDKESPGIDGIPNTFLKRYAEWCSRYLCLLFKKSLSKAELLSDWKYAKITPIPKTSAPSDASSYRPISLLCTCAKLLEHIIFKHVSTFLEDECLIGSFQHGFRRGYSTVTQLIQTVHDTAAALDKHNQVDIIFLDFEKAFDGISHHKLLLKLKPILKNATLLAWIEAYFSCRRQVMPIDDITSRAISVLSGIAQGSVLGPLFFLVYINDIVQNIPFKIRLFADDYIIYCEVTTSNDQILLNESLCLIKTWCADWQVTINKKKNRGNDH